MPNLKLDRSRWGLTTPALWFACLVYTFGDILFGLDTGSFGSIQALPSFLAKFGQNIQGKKALSTPRKSTMNSVPFIGKLVGTMLIDPVTERFGFKITMGIIVAIQVVAIIIELTAPNWIAFSVGRVFAYLAVGMVENAVPNYTSEVCPAPVRGFFTGSLLLFNVLGTIIGAGVSRAYATTTTKAGWMVPTGVQLIPAVVLAICVPFTPESPRWLVAHGQREKAVAALNRLRPKKEIVAGHTVAEVDALEYALNEDRSVGDGSWSELFRGNHLRRTMIATWLCFFEQSTGSQFVVSYQATYLVSLGLGTKAFTYTTVTNVCAFVACLLAMIAFDIVGRRPIIIGGGFLQIIFMLAIGGLGSKKHPSATDINGVVACLILYFLAVRVSYQQNCFLIGAEIGGVRLRKKTLAFAIGWDIVSACLWTIVVPYMLATLGSKVAFIFAAIALAGFIFAVFFIPELKGRSLEETDELFEMNLWAWQFDKTETTGVGRQIALLEQGGNENLKAQAASLHGEAGRPGGKDAQGAYDYSDRPGRVDV